MASSLAPRIKERAADPSRRTTLDAITSSVPNLLPRVRRELPPPASPETIASAQDALGFRLPGLLRELYSTVANGGFGPGYGLIGLAGGHLERGDIAVHDGTGLDLVALYFAYRGKGDDVPTLSHDFGREPVLVEDPEVHPWYDKLLVICNHGDWQLSCVDCSRDPSPVLSYVGHNLEFRVNYPSVEEWLEAWLAGEREF